MRVGSVRDGQIDCSLTDVFLISTIVHLDLLLLTVGTGPEPGIRHQAPIFTGRTLVVRTIKHCEERERGISTLGFVMFYKIVRMPESIILIVEF